MAQEQEKPAAENKPKAPAKKPAQKKAPAKAAPKSTGKATTKVGRTMELMQRKDGVTVAQLMDELSVGQVAARSLIGDVRQKGQTVNRELKDGVSVYKMDS